MAIIIVTKGYIMESSDDNDNEINIMKSVGVKWFTKWIGSEVIKEHDIL